MRVGERWVRAWVDRVGVRRCEKECDDWVGCVRRCGNQFMKGYINSACPTFFYPRTYQPMNHFRYQIKPKNMQYL